MFRGPQHMFKVRRRVTNAHYIALVTFWRVTLTLERDQTSSSVTRGMN